MFSFKSLLIFFGLLMDSAFSEPARPWIVSPNPLGFVALDGFRLRDPYRGPRIHPESYTQITYGESGIDSILGTNLFINGDSFRPDQFHRLTQRLSEYSLVRGFYKTLLYPPDRQYWIMYLPEIPPDVLKSWTLGQPLIFQPPQGGLFKIGLWPPPEGVELPAD